MKRNFKSVAIILAVILAIFAFCACRATTNTGNTTTATVENTNTATDINTATDTNTSADNSAANTNTEATTQTTEDTSANIVATLDNAPFEVKFIDVGQADAALIRCDDKYMLIDGGNRGDSDVIYTVLENAGVTDLEAVVATHGHEDHIGGLPAAFEEANVHNFYYNGNEKDTKIYQTVMDDVAAEGLDPIVPYTGESFALGGAMVTFVNVPIDTDDENEDSLVVRVDYGDTSFLFTGDASHDEEQAMVESNGAAIEDIDVLKVGHHGSDTSSSYPFLRTVLPEIAVISVGAGNEYGHPTDEALSRLSDAGAEIYRTDLSGDITITSDGTNISVQTMK